METIVYILNIRLKYLRDKENKADLMLLLLNIFAFYYIPKLLSTILFLPNGVSTQQSLYYVSLILLFTPLVALFIPTFEVKKNILPSYLPLPKRTLFSLDFISSLGNRSALSTLSMTVGFFVYFHFSDNLIYINIVLDALISILLIQCIINILSWRKDKWITAILAVVILCLLPKWWQIELPAIILLQLLSIFALSVAVWNSFSTKESGLHKQVSKIQQKKSSFWQLTFKEIIRNNMTRKTVLLFFTMKVIILFVIPYFGDTYTPGAQLPTITLLFFCPLFLFASIFNNSFGYFRTMFMSIWRFNNKPGQYIKTFANLLLPILLMDAILSMAFLIWFHLFTWQNILIYGTFTLFLIIVAIISSCLTAKKIEERSLSGMRKNTSTMASLLSMAPLYIILGFHVTKAYPIHLICLGTAILALLIFLKIYGHAWQSKVINVIK